MDATNKRISRKRISRRSLLNFGLRSAAAAGVASMVPQSLSAGSRGERATVMIVLVGGNDSNNMIVPIDDAAYQDYAAARSFLAIPKADLLQVYSAQQNGTFGFHPALSGLQQLYSSGAVAVLANEGALVEPVSKAAVLGNTAPLPANLFKHTGGDHLKYVPFATAFPQWAVSGQKQSDDPNDKSAQVFKFGPVAALSMERPKIGGAIENNPQLVSAANSVRVSTPFPASSIGTQLLTVAKLAKALPDEGFRDPVFTVMMSGFDTHSNQMAIQPSLYADLSQAMIAFYDATRELGIQHRVTTFTHTEFNRTLAPNDRGGTEHAWGSHHLIMGGAVAGGEIYGRFPVLNASGPDNIGNGGILIPSVSGEDYLGIIGEWHGAPINRSLRPGTNLGFLS